MAGLFMCDSLYKEPKILADFSAIVNGFGYEIPSHGTKSMGGFLEATPMSFADEASFETVDILEVLDVDEADDKNHHTETE